MQHFNNVHEVAGQTIMHMHIHIIPRYSEEDALQIEFNESKKLDLSEVQKTILG